MQSELDDANKSAEKECEVKALQTVIYIFSSEVIPRDNGGEWKFSYLSDKAYEYYLEQREKYKGQYLEIANVNGTHYDAVKNRIYVGIFYAPEKPIVRTQYEFTFKKVADEWIVDDIGLDS